MSDDSAEGENITLEDAIEQAADLARQESDAFEGEVPDHAAGLLVKRAVDLQTTERNAAMARSNEQAAAPSDEQVATSIEQDAVDIVLALGALQHEYPDLDIGQAFAERLETIQAYQDFQAAVEEAENEEEVMEAMDEHLDEELKEAMGAQMGGGPSIAPGDNVDNEDYDHEEEGRSFQ